MTPVATPLAARTPENPHPRSWFGSAIAEKDPPPEPVINWGCVWSLHEIAAMSSVMD
jgi:hypothetical protein